MKPASCKEIDRGVVAVRGEWILPKRLRQGIREALDGGKGKLRMEPQDLADLIGRAIDLEVERIIREAFERERRRRHRELMRLPAKEFFAPAGRSPVPSEHDQRLIGELFVKESD
jgi:hypothetical protein